MIAGVDGTVLAANDHLRSLVGARRGTLVGRALADVFEGLDRTDLERNAAADDETLTVTPAEREPRRWLDLSFERRDTGGETVYLGVGHDVTEHHRREHRLAEYERILETIEDGVYTLDESFTIETVNSAVTSMTGHDESELIGSPATVLAAEDALDQAAALTRELRQGDRDVATLTTDLETADGETLPIETRFSTYERDDGSYRHVGVVRDVSDRRQFARTLAALHDSTRRLFEAETKAEVAGIIAETAEEVLGLPGAAVYRFDQTENVLRPAATAGVLATPEADPAVVGPDGGIVWDVFVDDEQVSLGSGDSYRPLGDHGVLYAQIDREERDARTLELLELLTNSAEAALARVDRETALRERESEMRRQNEELRQLKQVNDILRRVDRALVRAESVEAIEQAVCEELIESAWFSFVWVGRDDGATIEPRTWAGEAPSYLDAVSQSMGGTGGPPAVRAARTGEPVVVDSVTDDLRQDHWRAEALSRDFRSAISVPLEYDGFLYGVLTVFADRTERFGDQLASVFADLGESIANAIQKLNSRERRAADSVVELDLTVAAPDAPTFTIAERLGTEVVCEGAVPTAEGTRLFLGVRETDPEAVRATVESMRTVASTSSVSGGDVHEVVVSGASLVRRLVDHGGRVVEFRTDGETADVVVHLATGTDVRTFITHLESRYETVRLDARRERETHLRTEQGIRSALDDRLTDRQQEVLRTAYLSGFFDWPRETTGEEVAEMLDITQPTVNRHLRVGERKLLDLILDE